MKKKGFNRIHTCPNCGAVYEMVPIKEIAKICKTCKFKKPAKKFCKRGVDQYSKRTVCGFRIHRKAGQKYAKRI